MNELINSVSNFTNIDFGDVRVLTDENGNTWFFGSDVCKALGYSEYRHAIRNNVDDADIRVYEKGMTRVLVVHGRVPYGMQEDEPETQHKTKYLLINEAGLYQLVCRSRKPEARAFMRWVTDEVIPSIRKHGLYIQKDVLEDNERLQREIEAFRAEVAEIKAENAEVKAENAEVKAENAVMRPKADFFDEFLANDEHTMCATQVAAMYGMSAQQLHKILNRHHIIRKAHGQWMPTTRYLDCGYMKAVVYEYRLPGDHRPRYRHEWEWTLAGEHFIYCTLLRHGYIEKRAR